MKSSSESAKKAPRKGWSSAKRFKVIGSALILVSFGMQMYQISASAVEKEKMEAAELDGRAHIKALGYENLYFVQKTATGEEDPFNLHAAAMQRAIGRTALIATSDASDDVRRSRITEINVAANAVHDLESFNSFMMLLQNQINSAKESEVRGLIASGGNARMLWWIYIVIFVVGSGCILRSQSLE